MGTFVLSLLNLGLSIGQTIFRGYVVMVMWGWFILTQFPSAPHIGVVGAVGLSYLWSLFTMRDLRYSEYKEHSKLESNERLTFSFVQTGSAILAIAATWLTGWIIHCFM